MHKNHLFAVEKFRTCSTFECLIQISFKFLALKKEMFYVLKK